MSAIRLSKLPDRTPIKLTIAILPELHQMLCAYAEFYRASYGAEEPVGELIPHMLSSFLASDRAFLKTRAAGISATTQEKSA